MLKVIGALTVAAAVVYGITTYKGWVKYDASVELTSQARSEIKGALKDTIKKIDAGVDETMKELDAKVSE